MSNKKAIYRRSLQWVSGGGGVAKEPAAGGVDAIQAEYRGAEPDSQIDVPDTAAAGTEYQIPFGSVDAATLLEIENKTGQDVKVDLGSSEYERSATGTLVAGTKDIPLDNEVGDYLSVVAGAANGGTPGVLSVKRKDANTVTVQSWLAGTGIQAADVSTVVVTNFRDWYAFHLPPNGKVVVASAALPAVGKVDYATVKLTAIQSGDGSIVGRVFGDPA